MSYQILNVGLADSVQREYNQSMTVEQDWFETEVENAREDLLHFDEEVLLEALVRNTIIDPETGVLTDYWMNLLKPELFSK